MAPNEFNSDIVQNFIQCMGVYPIGSLVELNTGEVGVLVGNDAGHKLKPQVLLVTDSEKRPRATHTLINLASSSWDGTTNPPKVVKVLDPGTYGIQPLHVLHDLIEID